MGKECLGPDENPHQEWRTQSGTRSDTGARGEASCFSRGSWPHPPGPQSAEPHGRDAGISPHGGYNYQHQPYLPSISRHWAVMKIPFFYSVCLLCFLPIFGLMNYSSNKFTRIMSGAAELSKPYLKYYIHTLRMTVWMNVISFYVCMFICLKYRKIFEKTRHGGKSMVNLFLNSLLSTRLSDRVRIFLGSLFLILRP